MSTQIFIIKTMPLEKVDVTGCIIPLTKEEVLMNVCERPEVRSNIFIERGRISVFERPQRLGQVPNLGELALHGRGFYKIDKQP
jgi:hypothetical protein|tara:strand:- start:10254 stop:10505 length:252 start_codon:yes stop_codon:yes gene_type:complete